MSLSHITLGKLRNSLRSNSPRFTRAYMLHPLGSLQVPRPSASGRNLRLACCKLTTAVVTGLGHPQVPRALRVYTSGIIRTNYTVSSVTKVIMKRRPTGVLVRPLVYTGRTEEPRTLQELWYFVGTKYKESPLSAGAPLS